MYNEIKATAKEKMEKAKANLMDSLMTLRAGRANPHVLDKVTVDYYGAKTPISQMASISTPEARTILIQPYDTNVIANIEKAILVADLGFNPSNDGKVIRLMVPQLTEERRKDLVKLTKKYGEEAKVSMRNIRRKALAELKEAEKEHLISEDELHLGEDDVQEIINAEIKGIDEILKEKETEILAV